MHRNVKSGTHKVDGHIPSTRPCKEGSGRQFALKVSKAKVLIYLPGSLYSIKFLLYSWGSLFGVPIRVPLGYKLRADGVEALRV